jgi:hypothetical protein
MVSRLSGIGNGSLIGVSSISSCASLAIAVYVPSVLVVDAV